MPLKWKVNEQVSKYNEMGIPMKIQDTVLAYPSKNIFQESVYKHVIKKERFCPHCNSPESHVRKIKHLTKYLNKKPTLIILNAIKENNLQKFDRDQIIILTGALYLTNGQLQGKILSILSVLGYLDISRIEFQDIKGKTKYKNIYLINKERKKKKCYEPTSDSHIDNWVTEGVETRYFGHGSSEDVKE